MSFTDEEVERDFEFPEINDSKLDPDLAYIPVKQPNNLDLIAANPVYQDVHFDYPISASAKLLQDYVSGEGYGRHHELIYDNWIHNLAAGNVYSRMLVLKDGRTISFEGLRIMPPKLTPQAARERGATYGGDWIVSVFLRKDGVEQERIDNVVIGLIPTMLKSRNCILHNKSPHELEILGEDPKDPGGSFIVNGAEKVVLGKEQLALNKIFLMSMNGKNPSVRMTVNTPRGTALIELFLGKKRKIIRMRFPSLKSKISGTKNFKSMNVLRVFRLFGIYEISEIKDLIFMFLKPEQAHKCWLKLTQNVVDLESVIGPTGEPQTIMLRKLDKLQEKVENKAAIINKIANTDIFPNLNELPAVSGESEEEHQGRISRNKMYILAIMVARFLEHLAGFRKLDDRDSWSNKRVESAGRLMEQLFRNAWRKSLAIIQAEIESGTVTTLGAAVEKIKSSNITDPFKSSFIQSAWGLKGSVTQNNVAQTLARGSVVETFSHINTINVNVPRNDKQPNLRLVQMSQFGFICPVSSPEGENCGLVKNLALTTKLSIERSDLEIINILMGNPEIGLPRLISIDDVLPDKVMVNGKFLGWCHGLTLRQQLITMRRQGLIYPDVGIILQDDWLYIDLSPSRLIRPLLIVDVDQRLLLDKFGLRGQPNHILFSEGVMEYMSPWEQEFIKIAPDLAAINARLNSINEAKQAYTQAVLILEKAKAGKDTISISEATSNVKSLKNNYETALKTLPYTHCEIDPQAILSVAASLIPWMNHNQAPRNTYQVSMGKQALGEYHRNFRNRFDGKNKVLCFPQRAVAETEMYGAVLGKRGAGQNINLTFQAIPYNEEDSLVANASAVQFGLGRMTKYMVYKTKIKLLSDVVEKLVKPVPKNGESLDKYKYIGANGLPYIGAYMKQGDCIIGKEQIISPSQPPKNESVYMKMGDEGIVDKVLVSSDQKEINVLVKLRITRAPEAGDKFAPRNAQKCTVGAVSSMIDMPVNEFGETPDIIVSTHCIPSRMTISYLMEMHSSKAAGLMASRVNATPYRPYDRAMYQQILKNHGRDEFGYETVYSGTAGRMLDVKLYMGPVYMQTLKHHSRDKIQVRGHGQTKPMTRQPSKGRGIKGGLRFGEMERDSTISYGASAMLRERLMLVSDAYQTAFCKICGTFAVYDADLKYYRKCPICTNDKIFGKATIPYAYKLLLHLLGTMSINLRLNFLDAAEYHDRLFNGVTEIDNMDELESELAASDLILAKEEEEEVDEDISDVYNDQDYN